MDTNNAEKPACRDEEILKEIKRLQKEVWYNRLAMAIFLIVSMLYIKLQTGRIGDTLGVFIEMFMPE